MIYRLPPLNALRVFEAAARHLSFKEAAAELSITQAAVSHQIKSLEEYLGVELFRRAGRGVALTEAARACLPRLREGFDSLAAAVETIRERAEETELMITAPPVFTARWLMPRLAEFSKREPKIEVRVVASSKMVDAGALDSPALMSGLDLREGTSGVEIHLGSGEYPGYRSDRLFGVSMAVVASPELVKGEPPLREPVDLANHVLLHDDAMDLVANGNAWYKWLEAAGVDTATLIAPTLTMIGPQWSSSDHCRPMMASGERGVGGEEPRLVVERVDAREAVADESGVRTLGAWIVGLYLRRYGTTKVVPLSFIALLRAKEGQLSMIFYALREDAAQSLPGRLRVAGNPVVAPGNVDPVVAAGPNGRGPVVAAWESRDGKNYTVQCQVVTEK